MPVSIPYRLTQRFRLVAAEVAAAFAPIVAAINGGLKADAFAPWMRLKNAHKVNDEGLLAIHFADWIQVGQTHRIRMPIPGPGACAEPVSLEVVRWSYRGRNDGGVNITGTVSLYRNNASGVETLVTSRAIPATPFNDAVSSTPAGSKDTKLAVEFACTGGDTINDVAVTVWCKAQHVR